LVGQHASVTVTDRTPDELATRGAAAVAVAVVIWGIGPILIKLIDIPGLALAFWRLWLGFGVLAVGLACTGRRIRWEAVKLSALGGVCFGLNVLMFVNAVQRTSIAEVTLVSSFQPVLVLLVAGRLFGERVGRREIVLTAGSLVGVAIFELGAVQGPVWSLTGDLLAVGALLTFTGYYLASKQARAHLDALEYLAAALLVAAVVATPVVVLSGQSLGGMDGDSWLWMALFVLVPGAAGHLLINWAHRFVAITISSVIVVGLPVVAAVLALVFLDEPLGPLEILGGAVVVACVAAIATRPTLTVPDDALPL
jgi:drug/metabolite transporter (DMT)-like permease